MQWHKFLLPTDLHQMAIRENASLAVNHLEDTFSGSPAVVDREFYLRGERFLYCIAERGQTDSLQLK